MSRCLWVVLVSTVMACGAAQEPVAEPCGPQTCAGCCLSSGACVASSSATCGLNGVACVSCGAGSCSVGQCRAPSSQRVDAGSDAGLDAGTIVARDAGAGDAGAPDAGVVVDAGVSEPVCPPTRAGNLALNGGFECAGVPFVSTGGGGQVDLVLGRRGQALRFTVGAGLLNNEFASTWRFTVTQAGRHCARAWVRGSSTAVTMRLYLGPPGVAAGELFDLPGPLSAWTRLPPTVPAVSAMGQVGDEGFIVFSDKAHTAGATIDVDDLDVWRSADGSCQEPR